MDNIKDDRYYIIKVIENIDAIISYTRDLSYIDFVNNYIVIDAVMFRLIQMSENISHISNYYKMLHTEIRWGQIIGFRNGIVHNYGRVDYSIVYEIISKDIIDLRKVLSQTVLKIEV